jgi:uncharacterized protein
MVSQAGCRLSTEGSASFDFIASFGRVVRAATLFVVLALVMSLGGAAEAKLRKDRLTLKTTTGEHVIEIEVADTSEDKALGLMYRQTVPANTGMLFPYEAPQELTMWMRNTYASLDMVFIKSDGTVHRVERNTEPLSEKIISSGAPVTAVLELAAGEANRLGVRPGDQVNWTGFKARR